MDWSHGHPLALHILPWLLEEIGFPGLFSSSRSRGLAALSWWSTMTTSSYGCSLAAAITIIDELIRNITTIRAEVITFNFIPAVTHYPGLSNKIII